MSRECSGVENGQESRSGGGNRMMPQPMWQGGGSSDGAFEGRPFGARLSRSDLLERANNSGESCSGRPRLADCFGQTPARPDTQQVSLRTAGYLGRAGRQDAIGKGTCVLPVPTLSAAHSHVYRETIDQVARCCCSCCCSLFEVGASLLGSWFFILSARACHNLAAAWPGAQADRVATNLVEMFSRLRGEGRPASSSERCTSYELSRSNERLGAKHTFAAPPFDRRTNDGSSELSGLENSHASRRACSCMMRA